MHESPCTRWLVLVACFVCHMTTVSVSYHAGVLHVALLDTFNRDVVTTAWLGSVYSSLPSLVGPLAGMVITTMDVRTCLVVSGILAAVGASSCFFITRFVFLYPALILAGIGQGFSMVGAFVAIGYNFPHQASLLTGICVCGGGLGIFVHPPLLQTLVDHFGLRGAMLIIGAVSLNAVPCGLAIPPSAHERQRRREAAARQRQRQRGRQGGTRLSLLAASFRSHIEVLRDFRFLFFLLTGLGFSSGLACYYLYLPAYLLHSRYDALTASFVLSATGMGSIPSRLLTGVASNDAKIDTVTFFFGIHALAAVAALAVPFAVESVAAQLVLAVLFGVYTGAVWASYSPLLLELLGVRRVATGVGLYLFTMGVGYIGGPPVAAHIYTSSGNFHHVFYFTAAMFGLASAACMLSTLMKPKPDHHHQQQPNAATLLSAEFTIQPDPVCPTQADSLDSVAQTPRTTILALVNGPHDIDSISSSGHSVVSEAEEDTVLGCPDDQSVVNDPCRPYEPKGSGTGDGLEDEGLLKNEYPDAFSPGCAAADDGGDCVGLEDKHSGQSGTRLSARGVETVGSKCGS